MSLRSSLSRAAATGLLALTCALSLSLAGCPTVEGGPPPRSPDTAKWLKRAKAEYEVGDVAEAKDSIDKALGLAKDDEEITKLAAQIHLAMLDYAEAARLLRGIKGSEAAGLRGRALWYKGDLDAAADELESMLNDPDVVDDWAKSIAKLARRGAGRAPFTISGGILATAEMPHVSQAAPYFVVPVDIDGEPALALVSTGYAEVMIDSTSRAEPSWVSLRFGGRLEVQDVPALTQDLSGLSKDVGAPIKAVLGVNLLRHLHVTIDFGGRQFVARAFSPPPPPDATRISLYYAKGGGMFMKTTLGQKAGSMLIDTSMALPVALDEGGWKKADVDPKSLTAVPQVAGLKQGTIPMLKLGSYEITQVPGYMTDQIKQVEEKLAFNIDGMLGNGLLAYYRVTLGDGGRIMWLEDNLVTQKILNGGVTPQPGPQLAPPNEGLLPEGAPSVIIPEPKAPPPGAPPPPPGASPQGNAPLPRKDGVKPGGGPSAVPPGGAGTKSK